MPYIQNILSHLDTSHNHSILLLVQSHIRLTNIYILKKSLNKWQEMKQIQILPHTFFLILHSLYILKLTVPFFTLLLLSFSFYTYIIISCLINTIIYDFFTLKCKNVRLFHCCICLYGYHILYTTICDQNVNVVI